MKNMKYLLIIVILGTLLVLSACGSPAVNDETQEQTNSDSVNEQSATNDNDETVLDSIANLLKNGKAYHCSVNTNMDGMKTDQEVYIDGEKYYVEISVSGPEGSFESNMINDGEYIYSWGSMSPQGFKMSLDYLEEQGSEEDFSIDVEEEYGYICESWRAQSSKFNPPSDVEFIDFGAMAEGLGDMFGDY